MVRRVPRVILKEQPTPILITMPVESDHTIVATTHGPNPGCSSGQATDCIYPKQPGGRFVPKTARMSRFSSSDPTTYSQKFEERPDRVCVTMTQSTGACEVTQSAQGRLTAIEEFPQDAGETKTGDSPDVTLTKKAVTSENLLKAASHGPNPGCSAGQATDCIYPICRGGHFVSKSASLTEFYSSDPTTYSQKFEERPDRVCVTMTQSTGACEVTQSAQGRLTAIEEFPQTAE